MASKITKRERPEWLAPVNNEDLPPLMIYNSLTNEKNLFKPRNGRKVQWYGCGPTVYDVSHMGHARTYISIDIIRRVMKDYLKFDINYVMNITDIDDKIIKRARQNHLYDQYVAEGKLSREDIKEVLIYCGDRVLKEKDEDMKFMLEKEYKKVETLLKCDNIENEDLLEVKDALSSWLDKHRGHTVADNAIFETLPRHFEELFQKDMRDLNILPPDDLTRVSEYIPQIVDFITKIMERDLAYESNGSVYFDTEKFAHSKNHYYAKLVPTAYGNESLLQEGEGALSTVEAGEKRSNSDFALWKASKKGEPSWESSWGLGRPGWHIECSAMAGDKCGSHLDIHTGGVDLKFPHHDNELAQSEAHFGCAQWVNYFIHTGHLTISGCKMSKSLKNFISIKDALSRHSWRQLRFAFLMSSWKDTLDYSDDLMTAAIVYEKMLIDFFFNMDNAIKINLNNNRAMSTNSHLSALLESVKTQFYEAICDSFDTRECMTIIKKLVEETNKHYISNNVFALDVESLEAIRSYVYAMMKMFGAAEDGQSCDLIQYSRKDLLDIVKRLFGVSRLFEERLRSLFSVDNKDMMENLFIDFHRSLKDRINVDMSQDLCSAFMVSRDDVYVMLNCLAEFRQRVRSLSRQNKWKTLLAVCDELRDKDLVNIGVRFQDLVDDMTAVGLYPSWAVIDDQKKVVKEKKVPISGDKANKAKLDASVDPKLMFSVGRYEALYSKYDETGLPTLTSDGKEVSKTQKSKLKKLQADQEKKYKIFVESTERSNI